MNRTFVKKLFSVAAAVAFGFTLVGCESFTTSTPASKKKKKDSSWSFFKKKEYQIPQSVHVTWAHDVLMVPGKPATRGFGGRFYFYNEKTQAIPVDGELVVYGFDDTNVPRGKEELDRADKRFRFTAEQFTSHFSEGELGASYSVWIPWDEASGPPRKIMLIPTFITKDGRTVRGAAANLTLPGKGSEDPNKGLVAQASATIPTVLPGQMFDARQRSNNPTSNFENTPTSSGLRTTTIQVPASSLMNSSSSDSSAQERAVSLATLQNQMSQQEALYRNLSSVARSAPNPPSLETSQANAPVPENQNTSQLPDSSGSYQQQPRINIQPIFSPPSPMPPMQANTTTTANGWALPEFSQAPYSGQQFRSAQNSPQAQASQAVQPASYPSR